MMHLLPEWRADCQEAIDLLTEAVQLPPTKVIELTAHALRKVADARDGMIERLRDQPGADEAAEWRQALDTVNVTLSELTSVEYPSSFNRNHLNTAIELLRPLVDEGAPPQPQGRTEQGPSQKPAQNVAEGLQGIQGGIVEEPVRQE